MSGGKGIEIRGLSPTSMFTVGAENEHGKVTDRSIVAKFLTNPVTGEPIQDPVPGGSQKDHIYINGITMPGSIANPENWLIVPANFSIADSESFAAQVAALIDSPNLAIDPDTNDAGLSSALGLMTGSFMQGGPQDLQRNRAWGIPPGLAVPAFVEAASYHFGLVTGFSGLPIASSEVGGGIENLFHAYFNALVNKVAPILHHVDRDFSTIPRTVNDTHGALGLSIDNTENIKAGFEFANSMLNSRSRLHSKTASNSAASDQADLSFNGSDHWVLNPSSNQAAESFQQGTDGADEWSIDGADFSVNPVQFSDIGSGAEEGKGSVNFNSSLEHTHTPDVANGDASHKSSGSLPPSPAGHHATAAFDMIDAYENLLPYISVAPLGGTALDLGARPVSAAMQANGQMIAIGDAIVRAEREAARTSPLGGASTDILANQRPGKNAQAVSDMRKPNEQTIALAAALYKAIHKEAPIPTAGSARAHRAHGPTGHRDDPIIVYRNSGL